MWHLQGKFDGNPRFLKEIADRPNELGYTDCGKFVFKTWCSPMRAILLLLFFLPIVPFVAVQMGAQAVTPVLLIMCAVAMAAQLTAGFRKRA